MYIFLFVVCPQCCLTRIILGVSAIVKRVKPDIMNAQFVV